MAFTVSGCSSAGKSLRPWYSVSKLKVARKDVPPGMDRAYVVWVSSSTQPKSDRSTAPLSYWPSIAASLVGW